MILLNQADALFEKLLEHLCSLAMTQQQEDKYITVINQYRETFRQLKVGYSSNEDMLLVNEIDNQNKLNCDKKDKNSFLFENFKTNIGVVFKKSIHEISKWFDECFSNISDLNTSNKPMCSFKMQEVEKVFDTIVNSFYRSKLLSVIPDVVFTLESTRIHKATIISQNYIKNKHRMNLKKGLDSFRRTVSRYYIKQGKTILLTFR